QLPILFTWLQAAFFKLLGFLLFTLWLYPALWSTFSLLASWFACRKLFSSSLSLLIWSFTAFSFWPLFLGRFSTQAIFMVFWEWLILWALGCFLKAKTKEKRNK